MKRMKKKIISIILLIVCLFSFNIPQIYAQAQKQDGFNLDFGKYDDKTAVVNYDEVNGKYSSFGRDRYICYKNVEFAEPAYSASISLATGQQGGNIVAICVDSKTNQVGEIFFPTDSWSTPTEKKIFLDKPISKGTHDLYIMMTAGYGDLFGVDFYPKLKKSDDFIPENIYDDVDDFDLRHKIIILSDLKILNEYEGNFFEADEPVTNIEFAKTFYGIYEGYDEYAGKSENMDEFFVSALNGYGLIDTPYIKFEKDKYISDSDALNMAIKALGYEPLANVKGGNQTAYDNVAKELKLDKGLNKDNALKRGEMVNLLYNVICTKRLKKTGFAQYGVMDYSSEGYILEETRDIYFGDGIVEITPAGTLYAATTATEGSVTISDQVYSVGSSHAIAYIGQRCDYWYSDETNEVIAIDSKYENLKLATYDGIVFEDIRENQIVYKPANTSRKTVKLNSKVKFIYNGMALEQSFTDIGLNADTFAGSITFVSHNKDKTYDVVLIESYCNIKLEAFTEDGIKDSVSGNVIPFDEDDSVSIYGPNGLSIKAEDLQHNDLLVIYASINANGRKRVKVYTKTETVTGTISSIDRENRSALIDGEKYKVAKECLNRITAGYTADYILNIYGEVVDFKQIEEGDWILGYLITKKVIEDDEAVRLKLFADGAVNKYYLADKVRIDGKIKKKFEQKELAVNAIAENTPVRFKLQTDGMISVIDSIVQDSNNAYDTLKKISATTSEYYFQGGMLIDKNLGRTVCPFKGTVLNVYSSGSDIYEDMFSYGEFVTGTLASGEAPFTGDIYTSGENDDFPDIFVCKNNFYPYYQSIIAVSETEKMYSEEIDDICITIKGYDVTEKELSFPVEMELYNNNYNNYKTIVDSLGKGDVIYITQDKEKSPMGFELIYSDNQSVSSLCALNETTHSKYNTLGKRFMYGKADGRLGEFIRIKYDKSVNGNTETIYEYAKLPENVLVCDKQSKRPMGYVPATSIADNSTILVGMVFIQCTIGGSI